MILLTTLDNEIDKQQALLQEEITYLSIFLFILIVGFMLLRTRLVFAHGKMPKFLKFTPKNLFRVYTSLCCNMILYNRVETSAKVNQIESHLKTQFPHINIDITETILTFLNAPVPHKPILNWLNKNNYPSEKKQVLIQFLTQLGFRDGTLNQNEYAFLKIITKELNIDVRILDQFIEEIRPKSNQRVKKPNLKPNLSHYQMLSVPENAPWEDIKKSYRKLVKQFHPDRVINGTKAEIENAAQKFREIQEAYDYLEKLNNG